MKTKKLNSLDIEIAIIKYFNIRQNLIVPNVWWGLGFRHECDLLLLTKNNYAWEIEIKISKQNLIKDKLKLHNHYNKKIKYLYFAIPDYLENCVEHIPEYAGIIIVNKNLRCKRIRLPKQRNKYKFSDKERLKLLRLGCMRVWKLKEKIYKLKQNKLNNCKDCSLCPKKK